MLVSEIKSAKSTINGKRVSLVKQENITPELHKLLRALGFTMLSNYAYKEIDETTWTGITKHAKQTIINKISVPGYDTLLLETAMGSFNTLENIIDKINNEKTVEKLARYLDVI